jgi:hypothetical protein
MVLQAPRLEKASCSDGRDWLLPGSQPGLPAPYHKLARSYQSQALPLGSSRDRSARQRQRWSMMSFCAPPVAAVMASPLQCQREELHGSSCIPDTKIRSYILLHRT